MESNDNRAKHRAISDRLSDYSGFTLSENGSVLYAGLYLTEGRGVDPRKQ